MPILHKFSSGNSLQKHLFNVRRESHRIGFVPTMGALHAGHAELIKASVNKGLYTVVSIFVNPTQFNDPSDLEKYPRNLEKDLELIFRTGAHAVYTPTVEDIYKPGKPLPVYEPGAAATELEGPLRPGHFKGVTAVVELLFDAVQPDEVFFGQKDLQQCLVIQEMIRSLQMPYLFNTVPTYRETDGLAYSSRNTRLSQEEWALAPKIFQSLQNVNRDNYLQQIPLELASLAAAGFKTEYLEVRNAIHLGKPENIAGEPLAVIIATWLGNTRLIDNRLI